MTGGDDGTVVMLNDGSSGITCDGITGFDFPTIRKAIQDLPLTDGAVWARSYLGQRPITLNGTLGARPGLSASARNTADLNLRRALRGLQVLTTLQQTPSGQSAMQVTALLDAYRLSGSGITKQWSTSMICPDPGIYSQTQHSQSTTGTSPISVVCNNAGSFSAPVTITVTGPITSPVITIGANTFTVSGVTVAALTTLVIVTGLTKSVLNNGTNVYGSVTWPGSTWPVLVPGNNTVQLSGSSTTSATGLAVSWRDTWI